MARDKLTAAERKALRAKIVKTLTRRRQLEAQLDKLLNSLPIKNLRHEIDKLYFDLGKLLTDFQENCTHARVYEFTGEQLNDWGDAINDGPMRICKNCGESEQGTFKKLLSGQVVKKLPYAYLESFESFELK